MQSTIHAKATKQGPRRAHKSSDIRPGLAPGILDAACITAQHACDMLVAPDDLYYHDWVKRILGQAGLKLWRLERDNCQRRFAALARPQDQGDRTML